MKLLLQIRTKYGSIVKSSRPLDHGEGTVWLGVPTDEKQYNYANILSYPIAAKDYALIVSDYRGYKESQTFLVVWWDTDGKIVRKDEDVKASHYFGSEKVEPIPLPWVIEPDSNDESYKKISKISNVTITRM